MQQDYQYRSLNNPILLSIKHSKKIINLNGTKYPIIKQVATQNMNFIIGVDFYIFLWTDYPLSIKEIRQLPATCRVNHVPQILELTRKNKLGRNLNSMKCIFPREYNFYPQTWLFPVDSHKLLKKHHKGKFYIVKPQNGSQGKGIFLVQNPNKIQRSTNLIVQEYIPNPYLIQNLKFDLRIYVLITSVCPLRVYIYRQGLVRFATQQFHKPSYINLDNTYSHLTNYAINKNNSCFYVDNDKFNTGHKRLLSTLFQGNIQQLYQNISDIVIKSIISALPALENAYVQCKKNDPNSCFQLLGFDVLLDQNKKPYLLEINQNPSLTTDTAIDQSLKSQLIKDILTMVSGNLPYQSQQKLQTKIKNKDKYQMNHLGNFNRIYPGKDLEITQSYDKLIAYSFQQYKQKFGMNILRNVKKKSQPKQYQSQPQYFSRDKLQKVYGTRNTKTSNARKRMIFY